MIEAIEIRNFKSLADLYLPLQKFNCLIGMNGAGKSTLLQAMDFLSQQMHGEIEAWLDARGWEAKDLYSRTGDSRAAHQGVTLLVDFRLPDQRLLHWGGSFNRASLKCTVERIWLDGEKTPLLDVKKEHYRIGERAAEPVAFRYQGSILSQLEDKVLPDEIRQLRDAIRDMRSLELLSPHLLRKRSRSQDRDIGAGGEKLSGYLDTIKGADKAALLALLKTFYPRLADFRVASSKGGWKRLLVTETVYNDVLPHPELAGTVETDANQLNDGLLRILAILAQASSGKASLLLLDEVENGINPEIVEKLVDTLVASPMQILVTTHSPMILNYLDDETARASVQFVYKSPSGQTRARRFFELPGVADKLAYMGPGEAFVDTNLAALTDRCVELDMEDAFAANRAAMQPPAAEAQ
ncbi:AAA family ATPase [Laribacter hongkongensis]|uniref:AAA family ATPase n=1 Tax=Laribacter hongkongensis TaxID=168471 RepID=UPI001EFD39CD|nr:AAA family ATPase [Laribacter hongkongensis]MCG9052524.1 AAA family ATPase [Laribacter hongkongensis]MCG9056955.1 AAA family ATPase [Laribacter hongkongensis]MCG9080982.1 AAA family ATPase [Laribacter hongkongensis]